MEGLAENLEVHQDYTKNTKIDPFTHTWVIIAPFMYHVFTNCITNSSILIFLLQKCLINLLAQKTVVYVTHQLEFLSASDLVLVGSETILCFKLFFQFMFFMRIRLF